MEGGHGGRTAGQLLAVVCFPLPGRRRHWHVRFRQRRHPALALEPVLHVRRQRLYLLGLPLRPARLDAGHHLGGEQCQSFADGFMVVLAALLKKNDLLEFFDVARKLRRCTDTGRDNGWKIAPLSDSYSSQRAE